MGSTTNSAGAATQPPARLYVMMHGLISLVDHGDASGLSAYLIDMNEEHRYLAGTWLNEQPIARGSHLHLKMPGGVGKAELDPQANPVLRPSLGVSIFKSFLVHSVIDLPRPSEIIYLMQGTIPAGAIQDDGNSVVGTPQFLAGTKLLVYDIVPGDVITLDAGENLWTCPALSPIKDPNNPGKTALQLAVLHVYNHPAGQVSADHNRLEFDRTAAFLGTKVRLTQAVPTPVVTNQRPLGLMEAELRCLGKREELVVLIVNQLRTGIPFQSEGFGGCGSEVCGCPDGHAG